MPLLPSSLFAGLRANLAPWLPPALAKPRFRLYLAGHAISVLGGWFQQVALSWLVFRLTQSVFFLGLTGFLLQISYLVLGPVVGSVVDRAPRVRLLIAIDVILTLLAALLALLAAMGVSDIRVYLAAALAIGIANAFETPARQSLFKDIVEDRELTPSAIATSAIVFNLGRLIGPALAGLLLLVASEAWCFAINAVSYLAIIVALLAMRLPATANAVSPAASTEGIRGSLSYLLGLPAMRYLLPTMVSLGLFATPYVHLMPSIVAEFFDGQASTVGLLISSAGVGAVAAALYLSLQRGTSRQLRLVTVAPFVAGAALLGFASSQSLWLSPLLIALVAMGIMLTSASTNAIVQQSVADAWRGRAIALYTMAFAGSGPIGNLVAGLVASHIGIRLTLAINACLILVTAAVMRWRLRTSPVALRSLRRGLGP